MLRWETLGDGRGVYVTEKHGFTTDTLLLADFSMPRPGENCAELGTGCGTIPVLWCSRGKPGSVLAVEVQAEAARLAEDSVEKNGFSGLVTVCRGDAREYGAWLAHESLDLLACNPPYYPLGTGEAGAGHRRTARHEESFTLEDLAAAARFSLKFGGRLCFCLPAERLAEAVGLFCAKGLEPKRLRLVQSGPGKKPYLFLLECRKGGRPGLTAEPTLFLKTDTGEFSREMREIYGPYYKEVRHAGST